MSRLFLFSMLFLFSCKSNTHEAIEHRQPAITQNKNATQNELPKKINASKTYHCSSFGQFTENNVLVINKIIQRVSPEDTCTIELSYPMIYDSPTKNPNSKLNNFIREKLSIDDLEHCEYSGEEHYLGYQITILDSIISVSANHETYYQGTPKPWHNVITFNLINEKEYFFEDIFSLKQQQFIKTYAIEFLKKEGLYSDTDYYEEQLEHPKFSLQKDGITVYLKMNGWWFKGISIAGTLYENLN